METNMLFSRKAYRYKHRQLLFSSFCFVVFYLFIAEPGLAFTANKVWFEFHPGFYRVLFQSTFPEIKELREGYVDFLSKREAEEFYFKLLRGADVHWGHPKRVRFRNPPPQSDPW